MTATSTSHADRLSDSDALMWRIEADPVLRSPILVVCTLDRVPAWDDVLAALDRVARTEVPRLRQRVVVHGMNGNQLDWVDDPDFAVEHHVRRARVSARGGLREVLALAEADAASAFDPARPPWRLELVTGLRGRRAALVLRFHHSISDGVGAVDLAERVFDLEREPRLDLAPQIPAVRPLTVSTWERATRSGVRAAAHPMGAAVGIAKSARSVVRMLLPTAGQSSPLLVGRGLDRQLHVSEVPLATILDAKARVGVTVNDLFLSAVGGALHRYHEQQGVALGEIRVTMPINTRSDVDAPGGNHFAPSRFTLPIDDPDPVMRARIAHDIVQRRRAEPGLRFGAIVATALNTLPGPIVTRLFGDMLRHIDVDAVDVPGLRHDAYLGGAKVDRLWAFAPPVGAALSITLVTHVDTCCIGLVSDLAAVTSPDLLATCFDEALTELIAS